MVRLMRWRNHRLTNKHLRKSGLLVPPIDGPLEVLTQVLRTTWSRWPAVGAQLLFGFSAVAEAGKLVRSIALQEVAAEYDGYTKRMSDTVQMTGPPESVYCSLFQR